MYSKTAKAAMHEMPWNAKPTWSSESVFPQTLYAHEIDYFFWGAWHLFFGGFFLGAAFFLAAFSWPAFSRDSVWVSNQEAGFVRYLHAQMGGFPPQMGRGMMPPGQ